MAKVQILLEDVENAIAITCKFEGKVDQDNPTAAQETALTLIALLKSETLDVENN